MLLEDGKNFDSSFVIHRNGKDKLIDGNNRFEAIKQYLTLNPTHKVEVELQIYTGLSEAEQKDLYSQWNKGVKQSTNDVVKQFEFDIPVFTLIKNNFPVKITVYGGTGCMSLFTLISAYFAATRQTFPGGFIGNAWNFVKYAQSLGHKDYIIMKAFMMDWLQIFGPIKNNKAARSTPFFAIFRIWYTNRNTINPIKLITLFKQLDNDKNFDYLGSCSGVTSCQYAKSQYVAMMNKGRTKNLLVDA